MCQHALDERWVTAVSYRIWCIFTSFYLFKYNIPKDPSPHGLSQSICITKCIQLREETASEGNVCRLQTGGG